MLKSVLVAAVSAICFSHFTVAEQAQSHQVRGAAANGVCYKGIYAELSIIASYPPAVSFCAQKFPVKCTSDKAKRHVSTTSSITSKAISTTTVSSVDAKSSAYSKCLKQPASVISTLCSCIQTPKACPTSKSTTKSRSSTTTTSSVAPQPTNCSPAQSTLCTSQQQNTCLCLLDTDGVSPVCSNGGACPQSNFPNPLTPCASDADCALYYPQGIYTRCVYTGVSSFCPPSYCATEDGCYQPAR